jgi:hypothetical protein
VIKVFSLLLSGQNKPYEGNAGSQQVVLFAILVDYINMWVLFNPV